MPSLTILKDLTSGNTAGSDPELGPLAKVGDTLLYTLTYTFSDGPVTNAVITDPIRPGLKYLPGSASDGGVLVGADANGFGGTVTWNLPDLETAPARSPTRSPSLRPLSTRPSPSSTWRPSSPMRRRPMTTTPRSVSTRRRSVASPTPTLPSTDTPGPGGGTSGGSGLALILLLAVGILGGIGLLAPAPARRRSRDRD